MEALLEEWSARIAAAAQENRPLVIRGAGSKEFLGEPMGSAVPGDALLDTRAHAGIVSYEPTELVVTVRAGTPLVELEAALLAERQMLAFEPPRLGGQGTVGGAVAAGLSGPRRQQAGAVRDFVLGVGMLDGRGRHLKFGGEVMKNVAGYDVSRVLAGSLGTLGLITEVSLKVLPLPVAEQTLVLEMALGPALDWLNRLGGEPWPISASAWERSIPGRDLGRLFIRVSGAQAAVTAARQHLGGEVLGEGAAAAWWSGLRDQTHPLFQPAAGSLWRVALPTTAGPGLGGLLPPEMAEEALVEWGAANVGCVPHCGGRPCVRALAPWAGMPPAIAPIWRGLRRGKPASIPCPPR